MTRIDARRLALYAVKTAALAAFLLWTNGGFLQRVVLLQAQHRWGTLIGFAGLWGISLAALLVAAFQSNRLPRIFWAVVVGITTAVGFAYHRASGSDLGVLDALSLWNARHEATRAAEFYAADFYWLALVAIVGILVFAMPPAPRAPWAKRWLARLALAPALPVVAIVAIVLVKEGGGSEALPTQFAPFRLASCSAQRSWPRRCRIAATYHGPGVVRSWARRRAARRRRPTLMCSMFPPSAASCS